jgi:hypothetical protein
MRGTELTESALCKAVVEMKNGLVDADLGGGVFKKRVALAGRGKRGGVRTLVATNRGARWFFLFGFSKNERENVSARELEGLKAYAADLLGRSPDELKALVSSGALTEICSNGQGR